LEAEAGTEEAGRSDRRSWKQELSEAGSRNFGSCHAEHTARKKPDLLSTQYRKKAEKQEPKKLEEVTEEAGNRNCRKLEAGTLEAVRRNLRKQEAEEGKLKQEPKK
jgi:hypothetical protein